MRQCSLVCQLTTSKSGFPITASKARFMLLLPPTAANNTPGSSSSDLVTWYPLILLSRWSFPDFPFYTHGLPLCYSLHCYDQEIFLTFLERKRVYQNSLFQQIHPHTKDLFRMHTLQSFIIVESHKDGGLCSQSCILNHLSSQMGKE